LLLGLSGSDASAAAAPYDLRYLYISGGIPDGAGPCARCDVGCTTATQDPAHPQSCANAAGGCAWWGCWQYDQLPPGGYVGDFLGRAQARSQLPMFTYYMLLQASGAAEVAAQEVAAAANAAFMARYLADFRFFLQRIGSAVALVHIEPDFWGYAEAVNEDPTRIPAAVASANPTDCGAQPDTIAGLGRCMIAMVRTYAPRAKVGLHASGWGRFSAGLLNPVASVDIGAEGRMVGAFLKAAGADQGDFVAADMSDRDADWYRLTRGENRWWDATNQALPDFHQALAWSKAVAEAVGKPILWWQIPVGNGGMGNRYTAYDPQGNPTAGQWRDNRVEYLLAHPDEVAAAHGVGLAFGAGAGGQTSPETDGGLLAGLVSACATQGGVPLCR
jgi:hypothetical protein